MSQKLSQHFRADEFVCPDCGRQEMRAELICLLEEIRRKVGDRQITISSGFRCDGYNKEVGGSKNSYHKRGMAADFNVKGMSPAKVQQLLADHDGGLGIYKTFTHIDIGPRRRW